MISKKLIAIALASAFVAFDAQAADALLTQGAQLMQAGNAKAAYALLEPQEEKRAGDKDFDLLFGLAALDVGQNTRAIFALERVLALDPQNARARAEIARAYLAVGEAQAAKTEFEAVKKQGVPPEVEQTIDRFLSAVERIENEGKTSFRGYVEATIGYDTNVNAAPARTEVAVPAFGNLPFTLTSSSRATKDSFQSIGGGFNFTVPVNRELAIVGGVSGAQRWNDTVSAVDLLNADGNVGAVYTLGKDVYSLSAQFSTLVLENDRYREAAGLSGQWQHNIDARNQVSVFVQYSDLKYIQQSVRDAERWVVGTSYAHAWRDGLIGYGSFYALKEKVRHPELVPDLGLDGYGVRLGGQMRWNDDTVLFANASYEDRRYGGTDPAFLVTRNDQQLNLNVGATYQLKKNWKLTGQYSYTDQRSNIDINAYDRDVISATVRYDF
ncbi:MAG TPA: surface lipoprotein assembly modifier [Rhodocyclaceae bacterium]|nr:surface lipoprotein assembly modifier [Rhodocyclaceae bacterium]